MKNTEIINEICEKHGIIQDGENAYKITGSRGDIYTVTWVGTDDCGFANLWECNCRAGQFGKMCKHLKTVIAANNEIDDELGY